MTPWAKLGSYGGGPHTGIDMYASGGTSVRAVRDGTLSRGSIGCGGGQLPYKKIDHGDGISTYYLHMR
jgi:murein DD-endopeptidase MepM/ murein hydrolase activator NlpD